MKSRCLNPEDQTFSNYGGRGISVHPRWMVFENFVADMGECPAGLTLERVNVNGNYEPGNCKWATWQEQYNNKRTSVYLEHDGLRLTVSQWAKRIGFGSSTIRRRLRQGMTVSDALRPYDCRGHQRGSA